MNALDRFMEEGETLNDAQQYLPIVAKSKSLDDIGTKEGWLKETRGWMQFAGEAASRWLTIRMGNDESITSR